MVTNASMFQHVLAYVSICWHMKELCASVHQIKEPACWIPVFRSVKKCGGPTFRLVYFLWKAALFDFPQTNKCHLCFWCDLLTFHNKSACRLSGQHANLLTFWLFDFPWLEYGVFHLRWNHHLATAQPTPIVQNGTQLPKDEPTYIGVYCFIWPLICVYLFIDLQWPDMPPPPPHIGQ